MAAGIGRKKTTVVKPFNLSKGKPRAIAQPIKIEKKIKATPVSEEIYKTNFEEIMQKKALMRERRKMQSKQKFEKIS